MRGRRLTPKTIDALPPAVEKRYEVRDALLPGLHLRVAATGGKVFYVSKRVDGRMKRIKIGSWPVLSLHDAREKARSILRAIELGRYVEKAPHEAESRMPTLGDVVPQFIELYAKQRTKDWKGTQGVLLKFSSLFSRPIDEIKRADIGDEQMSYYPGDDRSEIIWGIALDLRQAGATPAEVLAVATNTIFWKARERDGKAENPERFIERVFDADLAEDDELDIEPAFDFKSALEAVDPAIWQGLPTSTRS